MCFTLEFSGTESVTLVCEGSENIFRKSGKAKKKIPELFPVLTRVISEEFGFCPCFVFGHILF